MLSLLWRSFGRGVVVLLVLASVGGVCWRWGLLPPEPRRVVAGPDSACQRLEFAPDGQTFLSVHEDRRARLWSAATGEQRAVFGSPLVSFLDEQFSPDGRFLVLRQAAGESLVVWDVAGGRKHAVVRDPHGQRFQSFVISPDSRLLAAVDYSQDIKLWTVAGAELAARSTAPAAPGEATRLCFFPDGKTLAFSRDGSTVHLWDLVSGTARAEFPGEVASLSFSPDGRTLAVGDDREVRLREGSTGVERAVFHGHQGRVIRTVFSPDGKLLASAGDGWDGLDDIILWDVGTGSMLTTISLPLSGADDFRFSPDSRLFVLEGGTCAFDTTTRPPQPVLGIDPSPLSGEHYTASTRTHQLKVGSLVLAGTASLWWSPRDEHYRHHLQFSPQGGYLALGYSERVDPAGLAGRVRQLSGGTGTPTPSRCLKLLDTATLQEVASLEDSDNWTFSPDGRTLLTVAHDHTFKFWDLPVRRRIDWRVAGGTGAVLAGAGVWFAYRRWRRARLRT